MIGQGYQNFVSSGSCVQDPYGLFHHFREVKSSALMFLWQYHLCDPDPELGRTENPVI